MYVQISSRKAREKKNDGENTKKGIQNKKKDEAKSGVEWHERNHVLGGITSGHHDKRREEAVERVVNVCKLSFIRAASPSSYSHRSYASLIIHSAPLRSHSLLSIQLNNEWK